MKKRSGFTLIELLIVIGIIAILAGIVIIAVNPTKQFGEANDAQRTSDVKAVLDAVSQYAVDNRGALPTFVTSAGTGGVVIASTTTGGPAFCDALTPEYIPAMPNDPTDGSGTTCTTYNTGYRIAIDSNERITVSAPHAEQGTVSVTR